MKSSTIIDIFKGDRGSIFSMRFPKNDKSIGDVSTSFDKFYATLSPQQKRLYEKFIKVYDSNTSIETNFYFAEGFKLGLRIGIETMDS